MHALLLMMMMMMMMIDDGDETALIMSAGLFDATSVTLLLDNVRSCLIFPLIMLTPISFFLLPITRSQLLFSKPG